MMQFQVEVQKRKKNPNKRQLYSYFVEVAFCYTYICMCAYRPFTLKTKICRTHFSLSRFKIFIPIFVHCVLTVFEEKREGKLIARTCFMRALM